MKDRIRQLMLDKGMTQKSFASELCIAEATLSGIFNGRTRPTNLTVNAIHERFPEVNISWLMFGEGDMYVGSPVSSAHPSGSADNDTAGGIDPSLNDLPLFDVPLPNESRRHPEAGTSVTGHTVPDDARQQTIAPLSGQPQIKYIEKYIDKPVRKITEIRIFFDDGTYETFTP